MQDVTQGCPKKPGLSPLDFGADPEQTVDSTIDSLLTAELDRKNLSEGSCALVTTGRVFGRSV
jgi:hypothetical protein